ncbi:MAG: MFS transporter [Clostridia bacterium]|nr:MFS transporter [Clostridia bacterium]
MEQRYTAQEKRFLIACFIAYSAAYISRTNLSPALDAIQATFHLSATRLGLLPTAFALPYAFGQIVTGFFVDRHRPQRFMLVGLLGSALANVLFSLSRSYTMMLVLWVINGIFQSMIWTPLVRIVDRYFRDETRARALFHVSITLIVGYLCAWALSGFLTAYLNWNIAFRASGIVTAALAIGSYLSMRDDPERADDRPRTRIDAKGSEISVFKLLFGTDLLLLLLTCVCNGYVRDGIMNWAPKLLVETQGFALDSAVGVALIIPLINFLGIQIGKRIYMKTGGLVRNAIARMVLANIVCEVLLLAGYRGGALLCALFLGACSAMAYGINPLMTSFLPMEYHSTGRVGFVAGMVDALIYVGSALSGTATGALSGRFGWGGVFVSWILCSLLGLASMVLAIRIRRLHR